MSPSRYDLAIVGGGINGAGLAALAGQAGLSVVLFEKGDFGSGTSSKSTKLIHGGIRYLEQGRLSLVAESLRERNKLLRIAPHLVAPLPFLLPSYEGDRRPAWMLRTGLWLYDLLAGRRNIARHSWFTPAEALRIAPALDEKGLKGCGLYYDAQVNDARLVLENVLAAEKNGARCFNYRTVTRIERSPAGTVLSFKDERSGEEGKIEASCLVNASGPWADRTAQMAFPGSPPLIRPTRGSHIVVPAVLSSHAVLVTTQKDDRVIFVIPWKGYSLVGTTDLDDTEDPDRVHPTEAEIHYLLTEASRVFPRSPWERSTVISAFAGLRPLARSGGSASSVSRENKILRDGNVLTIVGGKLTTYGSMVEKTLVQVLKILGKPGIRRSVESLPGTPAEPWEIFLRKNIPIWVSQYGITEARANHLAGLYGAKTGEVLAPSRQDPSLLEHLHPKRPELAAQVSYAVRVEKAAHLDDILIRRLDIGYSPERWGEAPEKASRIMATVLGWSEVTRSEELRRYRGNLFPPQAL